MPLRGTFNTKEAKPGVDPEEHLFRLTLAAAGAHTPQEFWQTVAALLSTLAGGGLVRIDYADRTSVGSVEAGEQRAGSGKPLAFEWSEGDDRRVSVTVAPGAAPVPGEKVELVLRSATTLAELVARRALFEFERRRGAFLAELSRWVRAASADPRTLLTYTLRSVMSIAEAHAALVAVTASQGDGLRVVAAVGTGHELQSPMLQLTTHAVEQVVADGTPLLIPRIEEESRNTPEELRDRFGAAMLVPLRTTDGVRGALCVLRLAAERDRPFTLDDASYLDDVAYYIAAGLELVESLKAARQAARRASAMVDGSPIPLALLSAEGTVLQVNDAYTALLGLEDKAAVVGQALASLPLVATGKKLSEALAIAYAGLQWQGRINLLRGDEIRLCEGVATRLEEEPPGELLLAIQDRTDEYLAPRELPAREKPATTVGDSAGGITHEVNGPPTTTRMQADLLDLETGEADADDAVRTVLKEADRAAQIAQRLLSVSRRSAESMKWVQVNDLLRDMIEIRSRLLHSQDVEIRADLTPGLPEVMAVPGDLQQLFGNLITNAEHAVAHSDRRIIVFDTAAAANHVRVRVSDSGPGVKPDLQARIFDPYFTTKDRAKGTGLGLTLSQRIVSELGGKIWTEDSPLGGAAFVVELPIKPS